MHSRVADWLDLGAVLGRSLAKVRAMRGGEARAQGLVFLFIAAIAALFAWHFDLQPTIQWMGNGPAQITGTLPGDLALVVPALTALLYLAPTILGIGLPRLAADFKFAALLHIFVAIFDATTDFPTVQATMEAQAADPIEQAAAEAYEGLPVAAPPSAENSAPNRARRPYTGR